MNCYFAVFVFWVYVTLYYHVIIQLDCVLYAPTLDLHFFFYNFKYIHKNINIHKTLTHHLQSAVFQSNILTFLGTLGQRNKHNDDVMITV